MLVQNLDLPPAQFRIARVHTEQVCGKQRRLFSAGSRADFEDDVLVVIGIFGSQHELEFVFSDLELLFQIGEFVPDEIAHLLVFFPLEQALVFLHLFLEVLIKRVLLHYRRYFGMLLRNLLVFLLVAQKIGVPEIRFEFVESFYDAFQPGKHSGRQPLEPAHRAGRNEC